MNLMNYIKETPNFPKEGILFRDITPLLSSPEALDYLAVKWLSNYDLSHVDYFAGIESRGFILAMLLAAKSKKGFLPIRKAGKLPPPTVKKQYKLEYGEAAIEMAPGRGNVIVIDDVLATGGTLEAALHVTSAAGYEVTDVGVLINLTQLNNYEFNGKKIKSIIEI